MNPANRPLKVMQIVARLNVGGPAIYLIQLTDHLKAAGCEVQLVCGQIGKGEGDMRYLADERGLSLTLIPTLGREISPLGDLKTLWQLWQLIRRERPDVVHTHTAKAGLVGRLATWLAGVPVIVHTFHGHVFSGYFGPTKTRVFLTLERLCARLSSKVITLSAALKHELSAVYHVTSPDHIEVIELGFELDALAAVKHNNIAAQAFRAQHNIPPDAPLIGIVGRLVLIKNHALFLQAACRVLENIPNAYFAIVGDGELREGLQQQAAVLGITEQVRFTGWQRDLPAVYGALDALVLCSNNEGLPVSLIEAMAAGVPVISTAVGGAPDLLDNGRLGALVPAGDSAALAQAMIKVLSDPAVSANIDSARQAALERYSIQASVQHTLDLYRRLLAQRRGER